MDFNCLTEEDLESYTKDDNLEIAALAILLQVEAKRNKELSDLLEYKEEQLNRYRYPDTTGQ